MLIIRIVIFFLMVLMVSTYVTHQMSMVFLYASLDAKNQVIEKQEHAIKRLLAENASKAVVIDNSMDIIKVGIKKGCIETHEPQD